LGRQVDTSAQCRRACRLLVNFASTLDQALKAYTLDLGVCIGPGEKRRLTGSRKVRRHRHPGERSVQDSTIRYQHNKSTADHDERHRNLPRRLAGAPLIPSFGMSGSRESPTAPSRPSFGQGGDFRWRWHRSIDVPLSLVSCTFPTSVCYLAPKCTAPDDDSACRLYPIPAHNNPAMRTS